MNITCMLQRIKATHLTGVVSVLRATRWWGWGSNPSVLAPLFIAPLYGDSQNVAATWLWGIHSLPSLLPGNAELTPWRAQMTTARGLLGQPCATLK